MNLRTYWIPKVGDRVTYLTTYGKQRGIIKRFATDNYSVFVVYQCDQNWEEYYNYTGQKTEISDLVEGWI